MTFKFENDTLSMNIQEKLSLDEYKEICEYVGKIAGIIQSSTNGLSDIEKETLRILKADLNLTTGSMLHAVKFYKEKMGISLFDAKAFCDSLKAKYLK